MIFYSEKFYENMFGNIAKIKIWSATCIGQCTGCMCACRCSCSSGKNTNLDWENIK